MRGHAAPEGGQQDEVRSRGVRVLGTARSGGIAGVRTVEAGVGAVARDREDGQDDEGSERR